MTLARGAFTRGMIRLAASKQHAVRGVPVPIECNSEALLLEKLRECVVREGRDVVVELERDRANSGHPGAGKRRQDDSLGALAVELQEVDALEAVLGEQLGKRGDAHVDRLARAGVLAERSELVSRTAGADEQGQRPGASDTAHSATSARAQ